MRSQHDLQYVLPLRAGRCAPGGVKLGGQQDAERVHEQVLRTDQPRARRIEDSPRGITAAFGQWLDKRLPSGIEPLDAAAPDPAFGRLRVAQKLIEVFGTVRRVQRRQPLALRGDRPR
ncbi:hypothetical protein [Burkholderia ubonensis]|uniref:hypothetical protein n=1 Tax=Burkholderia ubonensis TaxID=101571 RepID=UPI001E473552|nr:hypothetical protein [Burkholderia ubonensis]